MFNKVDEFVAELVGTTILLTFGAGVVASVVLFAPNVVAGTTNINIAWGLAVMFGIYASGRISGGHLNPAVTIALALTKRFPIYKVWYYILAQMIGAFIGAAIVFLVYYKQFMAVDPDLLNTAGIFATFPAHAGFWPGFIDQVVGTALLLFLILATGDANNTPAGANLGPMIVGLIIVAIGMAFGTMNGYAINPARDLGPRLFTVIAGFKNNGLTDGSGAWLPGFLGPFVGGVVGAVFYDITVGKIMKKVASK